jgi:hypothetical protein
MAYQRQHQKGLQQQGADGISPREYRGSPRINAGEK